MSSVWDLENYKIESLVADAFDSNHAYNIDFRKHLKPQYALSKEVVNRPDGRPQTATYTLNGVVYAIIYYEFHFALLPDGVTEYLYNQKRILRYIKIDDTESQDILIMDKIYNIQSISDGTLILRDRINSRQTMVDEINTFISGALQIALQKTEAEVADIVSTVWHETLSMREEYISLGTSAFADYLTGTDLTTPERNWLLIPIDPQTGATLQQFILSRIVPT